MAGRRGRSVSLQVLDREGLELRLQLSGSVPETHTNTPSGGRCDLRVTGERQMTSVLAALCRPLLVVVTNSRVSPTTLSNESYVQATLKAV